MTRRAKALRVILLAQSSLAKKGARPKHDLDFEILDFFEKLKIQISCFNFCPGELLNKYRIMKSRCLGKARVSSCTCGKFNHFFFKILMKKLSLWIHL